MNTLEQIFGHYLIYAAGPGGSRYISKATYPQSTVRVIRLSRLATKLDPSDVRLATSAFKEKPWFDFTRSIHAINLLGRGSGELLVSVPITVIPHFARKYGFEYRESYPGGVCWIFLAPVRVLHPLRFSRISSCQVGFRTNG